MNTQMAYLLGMICGNGEIKQGNTETIFSIEIPHKVLKTSDHHDIPLYVKASISDIRNFIEPLVGTGLSMSPQGSRTILAFCKPNAEYLTREILNFIGKANSHDNIMLHDSVFGFTKDEKRQFLRGFADVTGYVRRSNYAFDKYMHRVYLEVPNNWNLVIDIANLLFDLDIPIQNINWGHPNMRDPKLKYYTTGKQDAWKKEHQIKIFANEFLPIGFQVIHKQEALEVLADELTTELKRQQVDVTKKTHNFYWDRDGRTKIKQIHPRENDEFIPAKIRGKHFDSWKDIAKELGYGKKD